MNLEERLKTLNKLNANPQFSNKQLYRLLYSRDLYLIAYERLKTNKGAMTSGVKFNSNVDGTSWKKIDKIIEELKNESYQPQPSKRVYIPKANGKKRPLGIPCWRDKLVQEGIKIILSCIYDGNFNPTFVNESFGFRPNRGCHHALKYIYRKFNGSIWVIKADVKGFFDNVNHHILIKFLEKRIDDKKFIRLIWKFLRVGFIENNILHKPKKGTPQGGNLSPILANIYLHEFDKFINELRKDIGTTMINNSAYMRKNANIAWYRTKFDRQKYSKEQFGIANTKVDSLIEERNKLKSKILANPNKAVINYARYADDWILGLKCNKSTAEIIFSRCQSFFRNTLDLEWNMSKSTLQKSTKEDIEFLGVHLHFVSKREVRTIKLKTKKGVAYKKKPIPENFLHYRVKSSDVFKRLKEKGYVDHNYNPTSNKRLINLDVYQIAKTYKATMNGIGNYYSFVTNPVALNQIHYWLYLSLGKTLAHKFKSTKRKIFHNFGNGKSMTFKGFGNAKPIEIKAYGEHRRDTQNFKIGVITDDNIPTNKFEYRRTNSWLNLDRCSICDKKGSIEMHHVKHIRKIGKQVKGFTKVLRQLNRKQIPVCHDCHQKIHKGKYDSINLNEIARQLMVKLGIKKWEDINLNHRED